MKFLLKRFIYLHFLSIFSVFMISAHQPTKNESCICIMPKPEFEEPIKGKDGLYRNYYDEKVTDHLIDSASIFAKTKLNENAYFSSQKVAQEWSAQSIPAEQSESLIITWLGHSTFLIQQNGLNILTDPVFYDLSALYPRKTIVGINPTNLPKKIDVIIISHNHRDHMDEASLKFLQKRSDPLCLVPTGNVSLAKTLGFTKIKEFTWWQNYEVDKIKFTFLPAIHWSNRGLFDLNKSLWGSWMISSEKQNIYFCGDSAYGRHFSKIAAKFPNIDIALMPIGPNGPKECSKAHMNASEAVNAFADLNANTFIPMHWGTFELGTDRFDTAINALTQSWNEKFNQSQKKNLEILKFGQALRVK